MFVGVSSGCSLFACVCVCDTTLNGTISLFVSDDEGEGITSTNPSEAFVSAGLFGQSLAR